MFEIGLVVEFAATHALRGDFGPASQPHGHDYRVKVTLRGPTLRDDGTLYDLARLEAVLAEVVGTLRERDLNELPQFAEVNPTAEGVARWIADQVAAGIGPQSGLAVSAKVWESPTAFARYER